MLKRVERRVDTGAVKRVLAKMKDERGFSLVELIITAAVIAIALFGLMGVFLGSLTASASADARTSAAAIATAELEGLRAIPYEDLGFEATATGYAASFEGATTVTVPAGRAQTTPTGPPVVAKGISFSVTRHIVWGGSDTQATGYTNAFKRVVALITWTDKSGSHTVRQDSAVYPGGLGPQAVSTTTSTTAAPALSAPSCSSVTRNATNPSRQLDLAWTRNGVQPTSWEIQRRNSDDGVTLAVTETNSLPGATTTWSSSGLTPDSTYTFEIRGLSGASVSPWASCPATSTAAAATPCTQLQGSVTPSPVSRKNKTSTQLKQAITLSLNTSGTCNTLTVQFAPSRTTTYTRTLNGNNGTYTLTIGATEYSWATGNHIFRVYSGSTEIAQIALQVNA